MVLFAEREEAATSPWGMKGTDLASLCPRPHGVSASSL